MRARFGNVAGMDAKAELAELVEDHLGRSADASSAALAAVIVGLADILSAFEDAKLKKGNWGTMLGNLRKGDELVRAALPVLKAEGGSGVTAVVAFADRHLYFAGMMQDEIMRLQAGESTLV
jgi:hypothetical protein